MEKDKTKIVAEFEKDNCVFIIREPKQEPKQEVLEAFYLAMGKIINRRA